ncbi:MAG: hypothetical protein ACTJHU_06325 [Mycetocola sp.]
MIGNTSLFVLFLNVLSAVVVIVLVFLLIWALILSIRALRKYLSEPVSAPAPAPVPFSEQRSVPSGENQQRQAGDGPVGSTGRG